MYNIHSLFLLYVKHHGGITNRLVPPAAIKILLLLLISRWSGGSNQSIWVTVWPAFLKIEHRHLIKIIFYLQHNPTNHFSQTLFLISMQCLRVNTFITITFDYQAINLSNYHTSTTLSRYQFLTFLNGCFCSLCTGTASSASTSSCSSNVLCSIQVRFLS